jgi:hypothetical protein
MIIGWGSKEIFVPALIAVSLCSANTNGGQQQEKEDAKQERLVQEQPELKNVFRFHQRLELSDRTRIDVLSWGAASIGGYLILLSDDSANVYSAVSEERDGAISECWLTDLDKDGRSEVIIAMRSAGSGGYGTLSIHELGDEGRFSQIPFPELPEKLSAGYMGHDSFAVKDDRIVRTFPIYQRGDPNAAPSGGVKEVEYIMKNDALQVLGSSEGKQKQE